MPKGIYQRTEEQNINISEAKKGKPLPHLKEYQFTSEEITKRNLENNPSKRNDIDENRVIDLYCNKKMKVNEIEKIMNCSCSPIRKILKKNNIEIKTIKGKTYEEFYGREKALLIKNKQGSPLNKNPRWLGGKSFEPYTKEFNNIFRELIRQRDNLSCLKCNLFQDDSLKLYHRKLHIHHIDYDKKISIPENCVSLCQRCNSEVNFNRSSWIKFFQSLLSERYGYQYSEIGEIILNLNLEEKNE